jgi:hypothetical protein
MTVTARIRFAFTAAGLAAAYFCLLVYLVGWMSVHQRPGWWVGTFSTRYVDAITWLVVIHTAAVLCAALPVAAAAVVLAREKAAQLGLVSAILATTAAIVPSLSSTIWPLIWNSHPVFFVTDQVKLVVAVPLIAWALRSASSNNRFKRSRVASSRSHG